MRCCLITLLHAEARLTLRGQDWVNGIPLPRELLVNQAACPLKRRD